MSRALAVILALLAGCDVVWGIHPVLDAKPALAIDAPIGNVTFVEAKADGASTGQLMTIQLPLASIEDGDMAVVFVTWVGAIGMVQDVSDGTHGYLRLRPEAMQGSRSLATFYYPNLPAATPYKVTVAFTLPVTSPDARVIQYRGAAPTDVVDNFVAATGHGTDLSGTITTKIDGDLVLAATHCEGGCSSGTGTQRGYFQPTGNFAEELIGSPAGSVTMTATQDATADWVLQLVAFKPR